jgi:hypothetical protein
MWKREIYHNFRKKKDNSEREKVQVSHGMIDVCCCLGTSMIEFDSIDNAIVSTN